MSVNVRLRILFVCAMNRWRSPTAEHLYRNDPRVEVRACGTRNSARRRVSEKDLLWADVIMVMERDQRKFLLQQFSGLELPPIVILDVPDDFQYMDPDLQNLLIERVEAELPGFLSQPPDP